MRFFFFNLSSVQFVLFHTFHYTGSFTRNPLKAYYNSHIFGRNYTLTPLPPEKTKKKKKGEKKKKNEKSKQQKQPTRSAAVIFCPLCQTRSTDLLGDFHQNHQNHYRATGNLGTLQSSFPPRSCLHHLQVWHPRFFWGDQVESIRKQWKKRRAPVHVSFFKGKPELKGTNTQSVLEMQKKCGIPLLMEEKKKYIYIYIYIFRVSCISTVFVEILRFCWQKSSSVKSSSPKSLEVAFISLGHLPLKPL